MRDKFRKCGVCSGYHWISAWPDGHYEAEGEKSPLPSPMIIGDTIDPVMSHANGQTYTSKAALRETYKPSGNPQGVEYIEVGNETASIGSRPKPADPAQAIHKAVARYERGERPAK